MSVEGFGESFKNEVKNNRPWTISIGGFGEHLPQYDNFCELDKVHTDAWGIPILHISAAYGDNEQKMIDDMADAAEEMLHAAGAEDIEVRRDISVPGLAIHEVGTARMGDDPASSVLNTWEQAHDVSNLFVMDGSGYPSSACQNPTITFMALATRACEYLVEEFKAARL